MTSDAATAARDGWRTRVLDYVDAHAEQIVGDVADLVRIPSVSGSAPELAIQDLLAQRLRRDGLDVDAWSFSTADLAAEPDFPGMEVERTEGAGVVARIPGRGDGPSLLLDGHVDVVPPGDLQPWGDDPYSGRVTADAVHGRGACDMKAGLVASLWVARALADLRVPLRGDLVVATVMGEEDGGLGTYAMLRRGWRADACVIAEPTSLDIAPGSSGALTFRLTVRGKATHASRRTSGVSAIEKFIPVFGALRRLEAHRNEVRHPIMERWDLPIPIELGTITAGDWPSSVPDLLVCEGRLGVAIGEDVAKARAALQDAIAEVSAADPWLRQHPVEVTWWGGQFASGMTDLDASIVGTVARAHASVSSQAQDTWGTPYGSDLRLLTGIGAIPTVHYGPGDAALAHAPREHVPISELLTATRALCVVALDQCGVA